MKDDKGMTPLHRAIEGGNLQIISKMLEFKQCDVNVKDLAGNTPLHNAAKMSITGLFDALAAKSANVDATNDDMMYYFFLTFFSFLRTPLHVATVFGNLKFVEDILGNVY
jgi:ankyrin repeat protein